MTDDQLLRYARHVLLDEIGIEGQQRLLAAMRWSSAPAGWARRWRCTWARPAWAASRGRPRHGGPHQPAAPDRPQPSRVGQPKAESAAQRGAPSTPTCSCAPWSPRADAALLDELVPQADVVLDCCDNFRTRHAVNAACVRHGKPLVSGAAIGFDGQISVYDTRQADAPCYACLFPPEAAFEEVACATMGVFAPLVGIVGSVQAAEALKLLAGTGQPLAGRLLMLDARCMQWDSTLRIPRQPHCGRCAAPRPAGKPAGR
jgi:molybdopterin/thiamine biosynthesis adenylyltransferase